MLAVVSPSTAAETCHLQCALTYFVVYIPESKSVTDDTTVSPASGIQGDGEIKNISKNKDILLEDTMQDIGLERYIKDNTGRYTVISQCYSTNSYFINN